MTDDPFSCYRDNNSKCTVTVKKRAHVLQCGSRNHKKLSLDSASHLALGGVLHAFPWAKLMCGTGESVLISRANSSRRTKA